MTPSEEVRKLLDERGVEWKAWDAVHPITVWHDETYLYEFVEYRLINDAKQVSDCPSDNDGHCELTIKLYNCTPAQAIAATVGRRDTMKLWPEWEQVLFANVTDEVAQDNLNECVHDLLEKAATVGRSCESCPEMDNPDSYIVHLHRALEVADSGAGTCHIETTESWLPAERYHRCKRCGAFFAVLNASHDIPPRVCPNCGRRIEVGE